MKILVVEDTRISLKVVSHYLERLGIQSLPAETGQRALEVFAAERPDMVLLDVVLPDIDGFEVARRLREMEEPGEWVPILFLTSMTDDEALARGIAAGGDDYLYKPVSEIVLGAKIRAMQRIIGMHDALAAVSRKLDEANRELRRLNALDWLTDIANRRHFEAIIDREWRRSQRRQSDISLLICDVDRFKAYNDALGHPAGDECLRSVARALADTLERGGDFVARYGGEEFAVILTDTALSGALAVAESLRAAVERLAIAHPASPGGCVTISIGVAATVAARDVPDPGRFIEAADQALYEAKQQGRNRVVAFAAAADIDQQPQGKA